ncbi:MAG: hypothetical protein LWX07_08995 [Bacteroidetes bacterium]|nr:hypothetical protein [Bacteroidota bacterium]
MRGPSRENLEKYYLHNRPYFDSLAEKYKNEDPEYYKEYIAPFYENPLKKSASNLKGCLTAHFIHFIVITVISVILSTAGLFFTKNKNGGKNERILEVTPDSIKTMFKIPVQSDNTININKLTHYQQGMIYFSAEEYELAEFHFLLVKDNDPAYNESIVKLNEIKRKKSEILINKNKPGIKDAKKN